jgi:hypothetical protein
MGTSVKDFCYTFETFLTSGIPNLQLKDLLLKLNEKGSEFHTYCDLVIGHEFIVGKTMQQARFSNS